MQPACVCVARCQQRRRALLICSHISITKSGLSPSGFPLWITSLLPSKDGELRLVAPRQQKDEFANAAGTSSSARRRRFTGILWPLPPDGCNLLVGIFTVRESGTKGVIRFSLSSFFLSYPGRFNRVHVPRKRSEIYGSADRVGYYHVRRKPVGRLKLNDPINIWAETCRGLCYYE